MKSVVQILLITLIGTGCSSLSIEEKMAWNRFVKNSQAVKQAKLKLAEKRSKSLQDDTHVTWNILRPYLPNNDIPTCLTGGELEPSDMNKEMQCSIHGRLMDSSYTVIYPEKDEQ